MAKNSDRNAGWPGFFRAFTVLCAIMLLLAQRLAPDEVWLMGANRGLMERKLKKFEKQPVIKQFAKASQLPLAQPDADTVIFAAGNIANEGQPLIERVKKEGKPYVS